MKEANEKLMAVSTLLQEVEARARRHGVFLDKTRFFGRKRDLLLLVRSRLSPGISLSEASFEEYMRAHAVKFPTGKGDDVLRSLFPEAFAKKHLG